RSAFSIISGEPYVSSSNCHTIATPDIGLWTWADLIRMAWGDELGPSHFFKKVTFLASC
ncbi:hypothetical protein GOODEAATRI_032436, partial [Goodea atripinnis]